MGNSAREFIRFKAMFCPICGTENQDEALKCRRCGVCLSDESPEKRDTLEQDPFPEESSPPDEQPLFISTPTSRLSEKWNEWSPAKRTALYGIFALVVTQGLSSGLPGLGWLLTMPLQILLYFSQGILVEKYAKSDSRYRDYKFPHLARQCAVWTILIGLAISLLVAIGETLFSLGIRLTLLPSDLVTNLATAILCFTFTLLGAFLYRTLGGAKLVAVSIVLIGGSIIGVGIVGIVFGRMLWSYLTNH